MNLQSPGCIFLAMQCTIFSFFFCQVQCTQQLIPLSIQVQNTHTSKHSLAVVYSETGLNPVYLVLVHCVVQDPTASQ